MSLATLVLQECARRGVLLTATGDRLRVDAPPGAVTDALRQALAREKPAIIEVLQADAQARGAGLVVLEPGRLYHAALSRWAGAFVERDGDVWEAYAVTWLAARQGDDSRLSRLRMASDSTLYRGKALDRALHAVVRWAGGRRG
jgi:hypothetical protein